jgi:hypothetical protein
VVAALLLLLGVIVLAWGLDLVVTADQDEEGARGFVGWILLVGGVVLSGVALATFFRLARRNDRAPS